MLARSLMLEEMKNIQPASIHVHVRNIVWLWNSNREFMKLSGVKIESGWNVVWFLQWEKR